MSLIEKASKQINLEDSKKLEKKLLNDDFTLQDFAEQLQSIKKMGSIGSLVKMMPGVNQAMKGFDRGGSRRSA